MRLVPPGLSRTAGREHDPGASSRKCVVSELLLTTPGLQAVALDWAPVVDAGDATAAGFGDAKSTALLSGVVFGGHLYLGTLNEVTGAKLLRSTDGTAWTQVNTHGFGDSGKFSVNALIEHDGALSAGTSNGAGLRVYRTRSPLLFDGFESSGDLTTWSTSSP